MREMYTKEDLIDQCNSLGIEHGMCLCVQVRIEALDPLIGGPQRLLEVLKEIVGKEGCIIVPCFSPMYLDPSCHKREPRDSWALVRKEMVGYKAQDSRSDEFSSLFMKDPSVHRSKHPVYSLAFWGNYRKSDLECIGDFPLTFEKQLAGLKREKAGNLLIGVSKQESLLLHALAKEKKVGCVFVQRAKIRRIKTSIFKSFLNLRLTTKEIEDLLPYCKERQVQWESQSLSLLSLSKSSTIKEEKASNVLTKEGSK